MRDVILDIGGGITCQFGLVDEVHGLLSLGAQHFTVCDTEADPKEQRQYDANMRFPGTYSPCLVLTQ